MTSKSEKMNFAEEQSLQPPPAYEDPRDFDDNSTDSDSDSDLPIYAPQSGGLPLPGVIPQVSKSIKGAFFSPFARAYIPELGAHGISCNDFVTYIDGLNEAFVAHPVFQGLGIVGGVLQMAYGVQPAQYAGMGLQVAAGLASAATSYARTRAYIKATNKDLFHPAGLHVNILTTKKMLVKVGYPEEKMQLPPLNTSDDLILQPGMKRKEAARAAAEQSSEQNDPRMRRLEALKGYVTPFNLDVPAQVVPDNFLRKMGAAQAAKMEKKQDRKSMKRQTKHYKGEARLEKLESRKDSRQTRLDSELVVLDAEFDKQLSMTDDPVQQEKLRANHEIDRSKRVRKLEKRLAKTERKIEKRSRKHEKKTSKLDKKEEKIAHKIRWLVITRWKKKSILMQDLWKARIASEVRKRLSRDWCRTLG